MSAHKTGLHMHEGVNAFAKWNYVSNDIPQPRKF